MFDQTTIKKKFQDIGSDVEFEIFNSTRFNNRQAPVTVNVRPVKGKEIYVINYMKDKDFDLQILDTQPKDRHLLMMVKTGQGGHAEKMKLLCGHDERHYFSCGVPEIGVSTVTQAKEALLPTEFKSEQRKKGRKKNLLKRKNEAGRRQGEWLFVKDVGFKPESPAMIKKNEPISRGAGSKPHICEELYSQGGRTVYVHSKWAPNGVSQGEIPRIEQRARKEGFRGNINFDIRTADAVVYVRGNVRHEDHKTIKLNGWHKVLMNTEDKSVAAKYTVSVFLD
jgi:hypothetical protein